MGIPDPELLATRARRERALEAQKRLQSMSQRSGNPLKLPRKDPVEELVESLEEKYDKLAKLRAQKHPDLGAIRILEEAIRCDEQDLQRLRLA